MYPNKKKSLLESRNCFPLLPRRYQKKPASASLRFFHQRRASLERALFQRRQRHDRRHLLNMGKRKAKKRSNSTLKTHSYFKRFQVKFARRRAGASHPGIRA